MERLEHDPHIASPEARKRIFVEPAEVLARDGDAAGVGPLQASHHHQKRRFAGAGWSDQADRLTGAYMQVDIFEDMDTGRVMTERQVDAGQSDGRGGVILHGHLPFMLSLIWRIRLPVKYLAGALMLTIACAAFIAPANSQAADKPVNIVVLGDSLSAGFGLAGEAAFPSRLAAALSNKGIAASVGNAGVSGDTASGG